MKNHERRPDPTPGEILDRCKEIRSGWSDAREMEARGVREDRTDFMPRQFKFRARAKKQPADTSGLIFDSEYWQDTREPF